MAEKNINTITFDNNQHLEAKIQNGRLYISIALEPDGTVSASGKTFVVASSRGNQATTAAQYGKAVIVGVNAYVKK